MQTVLNSVKLKLNAASDWGQGSVLKKLNRCVPTSVVKEILRFRKSYKSNYNTKA